MSVITDSENGKLCGIVYYWTLTIKQHVFWADNTASIKRQFGGNEQGARK